MGENYDDAQSGVAPCTQGVRREQWKQVRTHIHHYEQKLLELQFDYQQKVNIVEALKLELRRLTKDSHDCEEAVRKLSMATHDTLKKLQGTEIQLRAVDQDRTMVAHQLAYEQQGLKADAIKYGDTQAFFAQHLEEQHQHVCKLQDAPAAVQAQADGQLQAKQHHADASVGKYATAAADN